MINLLFLHIKTATKTSNLQHLLNYNFDFSFIATTFPFKKPLHNLSQTSLSGSLKFKLFFTFSASHFCSK